jgi:curved DNA-binding protein CbpA
VEVIRSSYRTMMQKLKMHPDLGGDHTYAALINEAFAVLSDPDSRADYDARTIPDRVSAECSEGACENVDEQGTTGASTDATQRPEPDAVDPNDHCPFCSARCRPTMSRAPDDVCGDCGSPLYPNEQRRFEDGTQRAVKRLPKQMSAEFSLRSSRQRRHAGLVQDLSLNGMQLRTATELKQGQIALIRTEVFDAVARVVNSQRLTAESAVFWRVGLVFQTMKFHRSRGSFVSVDV